MSSHSFSDLVGCNIELLIAEPWDFESSAGANRLVGTIRSLGAGSTTLDWILCDVSEFLYHGRPVHRAIVVARHSTAEPLEFLKSQCAKVGVNIVFSADQVLTTGTVEDVLKEANAPFLAGSAQVCTV